MTENKYPIRLTLGLGFTTVLLLMGIISVISLTQMKNTTMELSGLLNETKAKMSAANTMRDSIRQRGDTINQMYISDDYIERDALRLKIGTLALQYRQARDKLYSYPMSAREAKLLDELTKKTRQAKTANDRIADNLLSDIPDEAIQQQLVIANNARQTMLAGLDRLVNLQETISTQKVSDAIEYQKNLGSIILYLSLTAIFIAIYIAQLVIRETTRKNSEIHFQATHDDLTRLYNRKEFQYRLIDAHQSALQNNQHHALCFMDLDKFKLINDNCGHKAGDKLLIEVTQLIKHNIRSNDTLARLGGDEFGLLLRDCSMEKASELAEGIVSLVSNYEFHWDNETYRIGVSIGIVMITSGTQSVDQAMNDADIACYAAKDLGRNRVQIHGESNDLTRKIHNELSWIADLNKDNDEHFSLYLQPLVNIQQAPDQYMYEVLLRLNDDEGRLVTPGNYIPAAERFSMMKSVDYWVISHALEYLSEMLKKAPGIDITLFINLSANSLADADFANFVIHLCDSYLIPARSICFEIDEAKAVKNMDSLKAIVNKLRKHDIMFALDDFGTGVPSLSYLRDLPVEFIKIEGSIVKNIAHSSTDRAMVAAIARIGEMMNIRTVGKHVEDAFTLNQLKSLNIDYAQGYFLHKPQTLEECCKHMVSSGVVKTFQQ
jgi:diguanylate cyclase (GGDEF)-like protein